MDRDLGVDRMRSELDAVAVQGWDGPNGQALLEAVRVVVVLPQVRRAGLRGSAADQAAASAWAVAWEVLSRPGILTAQNPAGVLWIAVRRAVQREVCVGTDSIPVDPTAGAGCVLSDAAMDVPVGTAQERLGPTLRWIAEGLVEAGWPADDAVDVLAELAYQARSAAAGAPGRPRIGWRIVARRMGLPEWQVGRVAALLTGDDRGPGLLERMVREGAGALADPDVSDALRATRVRWMDGPVAFLARGAA